MKKRIIFFLLTLASVANGQGLNHQWLLGSYNFFNDPKGRILFDSNSYTLVNENRNMVFKGTEGNISDVNGNLLMSSNGVWIANSTGDTMLNGSGLNPGAFVNSWPYGMPATYNNIFLPFPADSNKYVLFHHTFEFDGNSYVSYETFKSVIDITLDSVILKNDIVFNDTLNQGFAACKHANGRDWWIIAQKQNSDIVFNMLLTPNGIDTITSQQLNVPFARYNVTQLTFSPDGNKFAYYRYDPVSLDETLILADFNRCSGLFSNPIVVPVTLNEYLWGLAFSPSGRFVYTCSSNYIFQIDINTLTVDTVAIYDGFISPVGTGCCATTFWNMYLAANGKIYITSGSGVQHVHEMNYPDSAGIACDVQQHAISLGYGQLRAVPNHPNYYLGCDTTSGCLCLATGVNNLSQNDFHFSIYPNPVSNDILNVGYLLPQNKGGTFQIYDITGKVVFKYTLPQWSNEQSFKLPELSDGIYNCVITSGMERVSKKIAVINE